MEGSTCRDPMFALMFRRKVRVPLVTKRGGASVLGAKVNNQWDDYLRDPALHLCINKKNSYDGYSNPLELWKQNHGVYG
jgi:hypothetical protein